MTATAPDPKPSSMGAVAAIGALVVVGALVWGQFGKDVRLCKQVFSGLVQGDQSVRGKLDWANLRALDLNVGVSYAQLPSDEERAQYEQAFVRSFAEGFYKSKADPAGFTDWRAQDDGTVTVEYPAKHKTAVFTLSESGRQVAGIGWQ